FTASGNIVARDGAASQVNMGALGTGESGLIFGSAGDTNLYRTAASNLRTDGALDVGSRLWLFGADTSTARVWFGSALATSLYRSAASVLKTDGEFFAQAGLRSSAWVMANNGSVANQLFLAADGKIYFGSAADTYLYRKAAQVLTTGWYFTAS